MIEARLRKSFAAARDSAPFILDIHLSAARRTTVLFGPRGAGKTLTLDSIAGFVRPDEGRILAGGELLFDAGARVFLAPRQRRCGYVFQGETLFPHMTVRENLAFAAERLPRLERRRRVAEMLDLFRLEEVSGRRPHQLSGGQKLSCSIARALIAGPRLLLLDEPARGLDPQLRAEFYATLARMRSRFDTQILMVTHDLEESLELGDEMVVLHAGRIVQSGPPISVLKRPASTLVARLLGRGNLLTAEILALDPARNMSRLRCQTAESESTFEIQSTYYPGHLLGDRLNLYILPDELAAIPRTTNSDRDPPMHLSRAVERSAVVRLEFQQGIAVEMPRAAYHTVQHNKEWVVRFPPEALTVLE